MSRRHPNARGWAICQMRVSVGGPRSVAAADGTAAMGCGRRSIAVRAAIFAACVPPVRDYEEGEIVIVRTRGTW